MILLYMPACSTTKTVHVPQTKQKPSNPVFEVYIASYRQVIGKNEYRDKFDVLYVNFANLKENTIGLCWWFPTGDLRIEIDKTYWKTSDFDEKKFLIYHELEHCIRNRLHTDKKHEIKDIFDFFEKIGYYIGIFVKKGFLLDGCPASLMSYSAMGSTCRNKHYLHYINELKNYKN